MLNFLPAFQHKYDMNIDIITIIHLRPALYWYTYIYINKLMYSISS